MRITSKATVSRIPPCIEISELPCDLQERISGGNSGIGQAMGSMLQNAGGMVGMGSSMGMVPGPDMGQTLEAGGGMKSAMNNMG